MKEEPSYLSDAARTHASILVTGENNAAMLVSFMITKISAEFHLDPFPDDKWNFVVKNEKQKLIYIHNFLFAIKAKSRTIYCDGWY